jgi:hypothetical protein
MPPSVLIELGLKSLRQPRGLAFGRASYSAGRACRRRHSRRRRGYRPRGDRDALRKPSRNPRIGYISSVAAVFPSFVLRILYVHSLFANCWHVVTKFARTTSDDLYLSVESSSNSGSRCT